MMIRFDNSYRRDLPGTYLAVAPDVAPAPELVVFNAKLAVDLGLEIEAAAAWFSGAELPEGAEPVALAYAGHQFGGFSPQLGDGRAHLLGEFLGPDGRRWDLQLKGSGRTAFSRGGDGKAALGPMLREYLISEAMAALRVPTTRSLAVVATGERILREQGPLPGAVLARVAASHIRVGTFQFFSARGETDKLRALTDYTLARHYPQAEGAMGLFEAVAEAQATLIAEWMGLGFVHGVMNTDNMALSGETIDYGPCAFMEAYDPATVFSSIDRQGRYAYGNQPGIMGWNLARLAEALLPLIDANAERAVDLANAALERVMPRYEQAHLAVMRRKLGLLGEDAGDATLVEDFLSAIAGVDWTLAFRRLAGALADEAGYLALFDAPEAVKDWLARWRVRVAPGVEARLLAANPAVIPRNHLVEAALDAAEDGDLAPFTAILAAVQDPFGPEAGREGFVLPAPKGFGSYVTYCGT
jgi:serine/tyrosine/threonine adenylyltransferase